MLRSFRPPTPTFPLPLLHVVHDRDRLGHLLSHFARSTMLGSSSSFPKHVSDSSYDILRFSSSTT
ncbi:hypothetical protein DL93DRAFT_2091146 [Clavulina sp. PMI_390]|nr:hypothetical protein DL93DRAFT_2091146 [Clavulina sp. PMI_390]